MKQELQGAELQTTFWHYLVPSATSEGLGDVATFFGHYQAAMCSYLH